MAEQHSSKAIMVGTIVAAIVMMAVVVPLSIKGDQKASSAADADGADVRIQPVAKFELAKAAPVSDGKPKDGPTVYNSVCGACHASGAAGAPKTGDKAAWASRLGQGKETLYKSAIAGKNAMPPKGGASSLSDGEIKAAVDYLIGQSK